MELRPLGFGEIFDRAITLYVRHFIAFVGLAIVTIVPLAIVEYVYDVAEEPQIEAMLRAIERHQPTAPPSFPAFFASPGSLALLALMLLVLYVVSTFTLDAVAVGVARLYRGKPVEFRACYAVVLQRWPAILGAIGIGLLVLIGWYLGLVLAFVFVTMIAALAIAAKLSLAAVVIGSVVLFSIVLCVLLALLPIVIALALGFYAVVIEGLGAPAAIASGFARVFNRKEFWRAVLFSIAYLAVIFVATLLADVAAMLAQLAHATGLSIVIESLARAAIAPLGAVLTVVYYFDVRIRREGYDLEAGLEQLAEGAGAA